MINSINSTARSVNWARAVSAVIGLTAVLTAHGAKTVQITDLGGLYPEGSSTAQAINLSGRAVGLAIEAGTFRNVQTVWDGAHIQAWSDCCSGFLAVPKAINAGAEAVGSYRATKVHSIPVYWTATGTPLALPALGDFAFGKAHAINDSGQIAGSSVTPDGATHAVVWDRTVQLRDLGLMGAPGPDFLPFSEARGINAQGVVVGSALVGNDYHAFVYQGGAFADLGLGGATHINNNGLIAGYTPGLVPVIWTNGLMQKLPALDGGKTAYGHVVNGINNKGDLVGAAPAPGPGVFTVAVLWRRGKILSLGHFPGGTTSTAYGINDKGVIVGEGNLVPNGPIRALRWKFLKAGVSVTVND